MIHKVFIVGYLKMVFEFEMLRVRVEFLFHVESTRWTSYITLVYLLLSSIPVKDLIY